MAPAVVNCPSYTLSTTPGFILPLAPSVLALWTVCMQNIENPHSPRRGISAIMRQSCQYSPVTHHAMWSFLPRTVTSMSWSWWSLSLWCMLSWPSSVFTSTFCILWPVDSCIPPCSVICPACDFRPIRHVPLYIAGSLPLTSAYPDYTVVCTDGSFVHWSTGCAFMYEDKFFKYH
jgi:hypothetical protein